jgi:alpha-glucosidase
MKRIIFLLLPFMVTSTLVFGQSKLSQQIGNMLNYKNVNETIFIEAENAKLSITAYSPEIIRVRMSNAEFIDDFSYAVEMKPKGTFVIIDNNKELLLNTTQVKVKISKNPVRVSFYNINDELMNQDYSELGYSWIGDEITLTKSLFKDERFIGMGEKTGALDRRGSSFTHWNSDVPAYAINADPLYATIPFYIGLHSKKQVYGIFLDNSYKSIINFGASTNDEFSSITVSNGDLNYYYISGNNVARIIENYTSLTGRAKLPPYWSLGYQQCRWSYYPEKEVYRIANTFREKLIPCDVIYLDINYMDNYKVFTFSPMDFPDPAKMVNDLRDSGFHVVCIIDPGLKVEKGYLPYEEGKEKDLFVKYPGGKDYSGEVWPGKSHFPDFTNPKTRQWWGTKFGFYTNIGIDGFWNDMNEPSAWGQSVPDLLEFNFDGHKTTAKEAHNIYGMQMSRATYDGARECLKGYRPLNITRATYSGGQRYSTIWTGDNFASDEHMLLSARLVNSLGLAGFPFAGSDIGGFAGTPSRELITRWLSLGVFTPFMRNHTDQSNLSREPWVFGKDWEKIQRELIEQRYQLLPYIYSTFKEATETGMPVSRTLAIDYSFDNNVYKKDFENEFLFGKNLLVCPISSVLDIAEVYLPAGTWYKLSNDCLYHGGLSYLVKSAFNELPVFVKSGAFVPMQNVIQYTGQATDGVLSLHFFKGTDNSSFIYYEDDGITYNFEQGQFYKRKIEYNKLDNTIIIDYKEGKYKTRYNTLNLILHGFSDIEMSSIKLKNNNAVIVDDIIEISTELLDKKMLIKL